MFVTRLDYNKRMFVAPVKLEGAFIGALLNLSQDTICQPRVLSVILRVVPSLTPNRATEPAASSNTWWTGSVE